VIAELSNHANFDRADLERTAALYLPLSAAAIAGLLRGRRPRLFAACLLSLLWTTPTLLILQRLNAYQHWWSFQPSAFNLRGMPLELFLGWIILWGLIPQLVFVRLSIPFRAGVMSALDFLLMPLCSASVHLSSRWLIGEAAAITLVLLPAICIASWTEHNTHLRLRALMQVAISALIFLYFLPELCFALRPGPGWSPLFTMPSWALQCALQIIPLLAIPGIAAVQEFAERGHGTPIPYDPPTRLVRSGIYRYCANPMQLSCALVLFTWALLLRNLWMALAVLVSILYSIGLAEWDERADLGRRFGKPWQHYRTEVHNWRPRWRPFHSGPDAALYIASTCEPCSQLRRWLEARSPLGLQILDAESLPQGTIRRMRYDPGDASAPVEGVRALGRALEHLNFGWAIAGATIRLPIAWQLIQLLIDACGLGPRLVPSRQCQPR
jgi:protein-S-isoprenylcysteine O-methyltransferase Ste14